MANTNETVLNVNSEGSKKGFLGNGLLQTIIKKCLFLLTFLLPLFWSPLTSSAYDFGKYQVLFVLASVSFLAWSAKIVLKDKAISFNLNLLDFSVIAFLLVGVLSSIFSVDKYVSLFGSYGIFSDGLIGMLSFGAVYFLIRGAKNQSTEKFGLTIENLLKVFFASFAIVLFVAYFSVSGLGNKFSINDASIQQRIFNTTSFSLEGLSVFISTAMVLLTGVIICSDFKIKKTFLKVLLFASLVLLIIIDVMPSWIILSVGLSFLTILALSTNSFKEDMHRLLLPIFFVIISVLFIFIGLGNGSTDSFFTFPQEQYLEQSASYDIALSTIKEGPKNLLIGSGPATWLNDFLKNKPSFFNEESVLWNARLNYAGSYIAGLVATTGVLGTLSYLSLIAFSLIGFFLLKDKKNSIPYISAIIAVLAGQFVYYQNTVLMFLAWFIFGLGSVAWKDSLSKKFSIKESFSSERKPEFNLGFSVILILISLSVITGLYFTTKECLADNNYVQAQKATSLSDAVSYLEKSVEQDPYRVTYRVVLSQVYLSQVYEENNKPEKEQDVIIVQEKMNNVTGQIAILESDFSNYVSAWELIGVINRDVLGDAEAAIEAFEKALDIDRRNPTLHLEIGKLHVSLNDLIKSRESFVKAQEMKPNYIEAFLLEALTYEQEDPDEVISKLKDVELKFPLDRDVKYQLGRLYYNQDETDLANSYFIETIQIDPNYSNAYYSLALLYEKKEEPETAIALLQRVLELNPGNQEVLQKIEELESQVK